MDEKEKKYSFNRSLLRRSIDEQDQILNHFSSSTDLFSNHHHHHHPRQQQQHLIYNQNILPISRTSQKRSIEDDDYSNQEYNQHIKRIRYEQSNNIELENRPPRATIKRRSLFLCHPRQDWNNLQMENNISSSSSSAAAILPSIPTYHHSYNSEYQSNLSNHFSSCDYYTDDLTNMFENETLMTSSDKNTYPKSSMNIRLFSPQSNVTSPLRTTNFVLDSKQQTMSATIMRTGNISPAHSDTSTESASTCSSDEQQFYTNFSSFHYQPSRSYRERENYEQLLDLAEKLSDPNRLKKVDIEQFFSYRYKTIIATNDIFSSKQTACVICMSPFKNGQRIRVLPCQHEYHSKCIARWFTMNSSCPICRRDNFLSTC